MSRGSNHISRSTHVFASPPRHVRFAAKEQLQPKYDASGPKRLAMRAVSHQLRQMLGRRMHQRMQSQMKTGVNEIKPTLVSSAEQMLTKKTINQTAKTKSLLLFASSHGTNLAKTLSPDGVDNLIDNDYEIPKSPFYLVNRCYDKSSKDRSIPVSPVRGTFPLQSLASVEPGKFISFQKTCRCDPSYSRHNEKKEGYSYQGCWQHKGIKDEDLISFITENEVYLQKAGAVQKIDCKELNKDNNSNEWKDFLKNNQCTVFRRQLPSGLYEYRVHASFNDISASELLRTNTDLEYRKTWDDYVLELKVVDSDHETESELVHWVTRCPYPFSTREYIYLRRYSVDQVRKVIALQQQVTDEMNIPNDSKVMRVDTYLSRLLIKSHSDDNDEKGCDYLLTYYDDPKMSLPTRIMDLATSRGISDSVKRMHQATVGLKKYNND